MGILGGSVLKALLLQQKLFLCIAAGAWGVIAALLQIIFHEAGHLAAGLLSGYGFSSFRIGSFMLVKEKGKLKCKKLSLAGTGGQCLMNPPDRKDGKLPFVFYNMGGSLMNLIVAVLSFIVCFFCKENILLFLFFLIMGGIGAGFALVNGIPMQSGMVSNDGYNAKELGKNPEALEAFWVQMKVAEMSSRGVRLKDMPEEWFFIPDENGMSNGITAAIAVFYANRLMDKLEITEAGKVIAELLSSDNAIAGIHRRLLICDRIFCELLQKEKRVNAESLLDKEQRKFMKQMKNFPSVIRTEYTYLLLGKEDAEGAAKAEERFEACAGTYPYAADIESERELMQLAKETK